MTQHRPERRARSVAALGLAFELLLTAFFALLTVWSGSQALRGLTLLAGAGILIWMYLLLIYHQRVLVQEETFESEQLRRERATGAGGEAIFDVDDEQLLLARRRLRWMYRWVLPVFTVATVAALVISALVYWSWGFGEPLNTETWKAIANTGLVIWFIGGAAFLSFLLSRYATGMARQPEWNLLRAGASWLMGLTLAGVALTITLGAIHFFQSPVPEHVLAKVLRALLLILAAEISLNFVLDFYRPRGPEEAPRPAFDSRLLGLFSEPGGIARSIAEAINYQFGFEVSSTWFYQLLQRSVVPLVGFAALALIGASSLVFVDSDEQAVIERWGQRLQGVLEPGLHVKYPWPVDRAFKVATAQIHEVKIGISPVEAKKEDAEKNELILWTNKHSQEPHLDVLVATPKLAQYVTRAAATRPAAGVTATRPAMASITTRPAGQMGQAGEAVAVSIMRVAVSLQYRIRDAQSWLSHYENPEEMLKTLADREIVRYCASVDVNGLIGEQRTRIEAALAKQIQATADAANLGVDLVFVGLQGVHPPEGTASDFQDVVGAEQKKVAAISTARADYNKRLSEVAGDVQRAEQLGEVIRQVNRLEGDDKSASADVGAATQRLKTLFFGSQEQEIAPVGGKAAERMAQARADRWTIENRAHGQALAFEQERAAKNITPEAYRMRKLLEAVIQADSVRKYIITAQGVLQLNLQDPMSAPLDTALEERQ